MSRRMLAQAGGLFAAGALVGGIVAGTVGASASPSATGPTGPTPGGYGAYGGYGMGPGGHWMDGHHGMRGFRLGQSGTVTSVGSSSVTIQTSSGTKTYAVDGTSDIDKNGDAKLSDLKAGDKVRFGVRPGTSTIAVLHAGDEAKNMPAFGRHRHCDGNGNGNGPSGTAPTPTPTQSSTT